MLEVGAGFGSITLALAEAGCDVLALEFDRAIVPALREVTAGHPGVRIEQGDAMRVDWDRLLPGAPWAMVSNLPYNVSVPVVVELLERAPQVTRYLVMVQREVGERFVASPGDESYGVVSVRVAYRARAEIVRRVPAEVFWPRPNVDSALVRLVPHPPPVEVDVTALFRVVEEGFAERRKTMTNALRRLGLGPDDAKAALVAAGIEPSARAEELDLADFARVTTVLLSTGWSA